MFVSGYCPDRRTAVQATVMPRTAFALRSLSLPRHVVRMLAAGLALSLAAIVGVQPQPDASAILAAKVDPGLVRDAATAPGSTLHVILRETIPASESAEHLVQGLGGTVTTELPIVGSFAATVPASALVSLARSIPVRPNQTVCATGYCVTNSRSTSAIRPVGPSGSTRILACKA